MRQKIIDDYWLYDNINSNQKHLFFAVSLYDTPFNFSRTLSLSLKKNTLQ